jgi:hypothetical protein
MDKEFDPETVWNEFWAGIVMKDGQLDIEQVKKELCDFYMVMDFVPLVYCHVTGGQISKVTTTPEAVLAVAEDHIQRLIAEAVEEAKEEWELESA